MSKTPILSRVIWFDAEDHGASWVDTEEMDKFTKEPCKVISWGYITKRGRNYITLAADYNPDGAAYGRCMKIPKRTIQSIVEVPDVAEPEIRCTPGGDATPSRPKEP